MSTNTVRNFSILNAQSIAITATVTTANFELPNIEEEDLMITNLSTATVFIRTGDDTVVADTSAMPLLPGEKGVYSKGLRGGRTTHIAALVESGTADIVVIQGVGA